MPRTVRLSKTLPLSAGMKMKPKPIAGFIGPLREQQKSKLEKHGEGTSHKKAKMRVLTMLEQAGWTVTPDALLMVSSNFNDAETWTGYKHEFDIYATKKHDNGLTSQLIIEIDGKAHDSKVQKGKDIIAENYAKFFLPDARFGRIPIGLLRSKTISDEAVLKEYKIR